MNKRIKKKIRNRVESWIIYKNPNGSYNSLGVNKFGEVPSHARPLHPEYETLEEVLNSFPKGFNFPLVELKKKKKICCSLTIILQATVGGIQGIEMYGVFGDSDSY